jgi:hypothetical protein
MSKNTSFNGPMNQMNPMYIVGADWGCIFVFCAGQGQLKAQNAVNTIFCTSTMLKYGSSMFIWFIGAVTAWLYIFFNEPNVHECSKGCSMRVFAMRLFGRVLGLISRTERRGLDELDSGRCTSSSLEVQLSTDYSQISQMTQILKAGGR